MRKEILLNSGWIFHRGDIPVPRPTSKGPVYSQSKTERRLMGPACYDYMDDPDSFLGNGREMKSEGWQWVTVPHDYVVEQDLNVNENNTLGYLHYDNAWYRKHFTLDEGDKDKRILLRFDGIAGKSTVYLNGCLMYHNFSSYNTFEIDITDTVYFGRKNIIAVYVNTEDFEGWWYQGGGIYRDVHLTVTDPVAIDLWGVYAPYEKINETDFQVNFETTVLNTDYTDCLVTVESRISDKNGTVVATASGEGAVCLRDKNILRYSAVVHHPLLWDTENPNLYSVTTALYKDGVKIDEDVTRIGFRTVEFTVDGLFLNGKKTFINGVCAHQDIGLVGLAVTENIAKYKVALMKEMGANGYRTSHYQQTAYYMDAFDEMGFLVMDEARWFESTKEGLEQLETLVKRDRNRPSVIMWSTSNEEPFHVTENGKRIHRALYAHIRKLDKTRPITAAEDKTPDKSTIYEYSDVIGINYNLNIYDTVHEMCPEKPIFSSECCAVGTTRNWAFPTNTNGRTQDFDVDANTWFLGREKTYKFLRERPFVFGLYQWAAVEHRGESLWPRMCSIAGALDIFLQKKGAFYQNKSLWTEEPMVHIVPHWNFAGLEGQEIFVPIYTNCDELELFLNGRSLGRKTIEKYGHGEWWVPYEKGSLTAVGYRIGKAVAKDERKTTLKAARLKLTLDNRFSFNDNDIALFTCECLDENGDPVPDASKYVTFSVNAPAKIVGTGSDNTDPISVTANSRKMYMGKISIAVKAAATQEKLVLIAQSDSCDRGMITIHNPAKQ